ncbi:MAG: hypothetical protein ABIT36_09690, partial [Steroidobacteraceae bacterium]
MFTVVVAAWAGLAVQPAAAADKSAAKAPTISKSAQKPLSDAQALIGEKKYDEALAALATLESDPKMTPYDVFVVHQLRVAALNQAGRIGEAIPSLEAEVDSGFLTPEDSEKMSRIVAGLHFQNKDYPKAAETGQKVIASGKADDDTWVRVGSALYLSDKPADAARVMNT